VGLWRYAAGPLFLYTEANMADSPRSRKLAKRILQIVATAIESEIKDPRLKFVTITDARITADLRDATVYYTVMPETFGTDPDVIGAKEALEKAKGTLRSKVGAGTGVRYTPSLAFQTDTVPDEARRIEELLAKAREVDAAVAAKAAGAVHAGESDPYKAPKEDEEG
jgi:ribosome-binding factor A